ncbi:MAG: TraR/DksA family transcriptional regulator [Verrucomicrobia bacterium]|nr:TraR/DksA family transcriptional regulator [Verrucomicrobiota bacterium]MBU1735478.1 TraR/DksA family transcriptional regulator [Verrucomicrobiota bacterium]MBU1856873.1 TraR/DksA family transcriptional regulator [Verrucomicrobiota bacterium]
MAKVKKAIKALKKSISKKSGAKPKTTAKLAKKPTAGKKPVVGKRPAVRGKSRFQAPLPVVVEKLAAMIGKGNKYLSTDIKRELREKLLRLRERITGQINFLAADNLSRTQKDAEVDFRSEEQGTDNFDRDFALNRVSLEQDVVFEIDEALNRIKIGTYGACESCGGPIEKARIIALPYSRMCVGCQSKLETGRKKFRSFETAALFPNADKAVPETTSEEE